MLCALRQRLGTAAGLARHLDSGWACSQRQLCAQSDWSTICVLDPRLVLDASLPSSPPTGAGGLAVLTRAPPHVMSALPSARCEVSDGGDPQCSWAIGDAAELFEYRLVGMHASPSQLTAILRLTHLASDASTADLHAFLAELRASAPANALEEFASLAAKVEPEARAGAAACAGPETAHLAAAGAECVFIGGLKECESVSVYAKKGGGGLLLASNYEAL